MEEKSYIRNYSYNFFYQNLDIFKDDGVISIVEFLNTGTMHNIILNCNCNYVIAIIMPVSEYNSQVWCQPSFQLHRRVLES